MTQQTAPQTRRPSTRGMSLSEAIATIGFTPVVRNWDLGPCHRWEGALTSNGYASLRNQRLSRLVLAEKLGRPLEAHERACHSCDFPDCIAPDHLFLGTQRDNMRDAARKGRMANMGPRPRHAFTSWALAEKLMDQGLSSAEIGRQTGISWRHLSNVRAGRKPWPAYYLKARTASAGEEN